ncbi:MAG TPA: YjbQ family protein [Chromatiales bacterium]|nr:YjbQ family protein [Chromatiales bacterium]
MVHQQTLSVRTRGRGTYDVTGEVARVVAASGVAAGLCHVFCRHTSASLMLCENADPDVRRDLEAFMARLVPDGDPLFRHTLEGPDDMPAHVRTVLTASGLTVPVTDRRLALGTWQGIYLWEHRTAPHRRTLVVTVQGSAEAGGGP